MLCPSRLQLFAIDFAILTQERITLLQSVVLTSEEEDQLRNFEGNVAEVSDVDRFYLAILDVPRSASRPRARTHTPWSRAPPSSQARTLCSRSPHPPPPTAPLAL